MNRFSRLAPVLALVAAFAAALTLSALAAVGAGFSPVGASTPAAQDQYPRRVTICHRSGRNLKRSRYRTIRVTRRAVRAHVRRHGDGIGPCSRARFTICHKVRNKRGKVVRQRTRVVRGAKAHRRHMRHGDKIRACPRKKRKR
jgi:hypothetical protein